MTLKAIEKYERFVDDVEECTARYVDAFPELKQEIKTLRVNKTIVRNSLVLELDPNKESVFDDLGEQQLLTKSWRAAAQLTHPDHGGDPAIFRYARALFKSKDLQALNGLVIVLRSNAFSEYNSFIQRKLNALYELQKSKTSYTVLCLHRAGRFAEAKELVHQTLLKTKAQLLLLD